jgi:hypothetical protein
LKQVFSHQDAVPHDQGSSWNIEASDGEVLGQDPQVAIGGWKKSETLLEDNQG